MYSKKVREYYRKFYGKTYYNMSDITERINFGNMKGHGNYYLYKLKWGNNHSYWGVTGNPPHKRLQSHCSDRGLDRDRVKMIIVRAFYDRKDAERCEQFKIDQDYYKVGNHNKN